MRLVDAKKALSVLGYFDGQPDSDPREPNWRGDLRRFQRDYGLDADGLYGPKTDAMVAPLYAQVVRALGGDPSFVRMQRWQLTAYWIGRARPGAVPVFAPNRTVLDRVSPSSFVEAALEGTTILTDGRLVNVASNPSTLPAAADDYAAVYAIAEKNGWVPDKLGYAGIRATGGRVTDARTFQVVPTGPGGWPYWNQIEADPFRTLAADLGRFGKSEPRFKGNGGLVPVGTKVFILQLCGRALPDGSTHDGWCTVNDTGSAIYGAHFDVFTGSKANYTARPFPGRGLIWFAGVESRCGIDYSYGLT